MRKKSIEVEAGTIAEAIKKALGMLNVDEKEVTIKILKEEHKGLFGMEGAQLAKIKATLKDKEPKPSKEKEKE
ncbi:MAG: Jag N-terminal domain-containing protein [Candidatus Omnitrophota bacterium]|nr:Jag N-terminal domain-containing protein [Candidatus Omnitrophota bacterium]